MGCPDHRDAAALVITNGRVAGHISAFPELRAALHRLELMLQREVLRLRARHQLVEHDFRGLFISDEYVDALFQNTDQPAPSHQSLSDQIDLLAASERYDVGSPLAQLSTLFELSEVERDILLIALAPALDSRFEDFFAYAQNDVARRAPTVDLALKLLCGDFEDRLPAQSCFHWDRPLRKSQLLTLTPPQSGPAAPLLAHTLGIEPRIVAHLLGQDVLDEQIRAFSELVVPDRDLWSLPFGDHLLHQLDRATQALTDAPGLICLHGPKGVGRQSVAAALCARRGWNLIAVDWDAACRSGQNPQASLARINREATLRGAAVYMHGEKEAMPDVSEIRVPVFWGQTTPIFEVDLDAPLFIFELPRPNYEQRLSLWQRHLADLPQAADLSFAAVANKFSLTEGQIKAAAHQVAATLKARTSDAEHVTDDHLHQAARWCSNQALRELARKVELKHTWSDAILSPLCARQLHELYLSARHRHTVYSQWGFDAKLSSGKGVTALFYGPSGTGKTMAAGILAHELGLDLYQIDLATVVSKYIGETEQNLSRIYHAAEASNAILLFDEADALFGKRSEVKDARDRYANIEVAYLLQMMEAYDGIAILATNLHNNIDDAFARRLHHTVEFVTPDIKMREQLWCSVFPSQTPLSPQLDFGFLARQFEITGGNIRNAALIAAFSAADAEQPVTMEMIVTAVAREFQKIGKLSTRDAFQHYYRALQQD
jgi:SpoVK/Ycf46/Vps4 family AAA+-type ATPase